MRISIVIASLNPGAMLQRCLDNIAQQDHGDIEVVEQRVMMEHRLMGQVVAAAAEFAGRPGTGQKIDLLPLGGYQAT